jgi:hypothetical protein
MFAHFDRFSIELTKNEANMGSHQGQCDNDVAHLLTYPKVKRQLAKIPDDVLARALKEYGAWDETELKDREANNARIIWIACGNILEEIN